VHLLTPAGSEPDALHIHCGNGQQILRWLGYAAAAQLALRQDQPLGRYVPRAVLKDGCVLDVDLVLAEVAADGAELTVELYNGPVAYDARCVATRACARTTKKHPIFVVSCFVLHAHL
jgi:hypothetical protein